MDNQLRDRRHALEDSWRTAVLEGNTAVDARSDVVSSWARSARAVSPEILEAPVAAAEDVVRDWEDSALGRACRVILDDLSDLAADGDLMAAITDETVTIAWAAGGRTMTRRADEVHFTRGGCWAETAVGTNALALACVTARPATVFSAEHFAPMVHDWVCYSAPVTDPHSGRFLGVLDLSTTWEKAHPALLTTVGALARCVEHELSALYPAGAPSPASTVGRPVGVIELTTLGPPSVRLGGVTIPVTRRQIELLTVLSLHPEGCTLDELTGRVYGDRPVGRSTVKAELSHLRHLLGGRIGSRPYRLVGAVEADHRRLLAAVSAGDVATAVHCYGGPMLTASDSPEIEVWRNHIDAAIRDAALAAGQPDLLYELGERCADDAFLQAATLDALDAGDTRRSIVAGRIAAAST